MIRGWIWRDLREHISIDTSITSYLEGGAELWLSAYTLAARPRGGDRRAGRGTVTVRGWGQLEYVVTNADTERGNAWKLGGNSEISGSRYS